MDTNSRSRGARALSKAATGPGTVKGAEDPIANPTYQAWAKRDALTRLLLGAGVGLGAGVAGRGLLGAYQEATRPTVNPFLHSSPVSTPLPVYGMDEEEEAPPPARPRRVAKAAAAPPPLAPPEPGPFQSVANHLPDLDTNNPTNAAWMMPAMTAAVGAPMLGGWALTDWLLKNRHSSDTASQVQDAEGDFEHALADEYRAAMRGQKTANDQTNPLTQAIDELYDTLHDAFQKQADPLEWEKFLWKPWELAAGADNTAQMRGLIGTAALLSAAGSGALAYKYTRSQSPEEATRKAIRLRARQRAAAPVPPYAVLANPGG